MIGSHRLGQGCRKPPGTGLAAFLDKDHVWRETALLIVYRDIKRDGLGEGRQAFDRECFPSHRRATDLVTISKEPRLWRGQVANEPHGVVIAVGNHRLGRAKCAVHGFRVI